MVLDETAELKKGTATAGVARKAPVSAVAAMIPRTAWETRSCGRGCKGHLDYE